jgi:outer membrane immunogenic protein
MKRPLLSTIVLTAFATAAAAADLPSRTAPQVPFAAAAPFAWSGFYVGAHAGYVWSDSDMTLAGVGVAVLPIDVERGTLPRSMAVDRDGFAGGLQAGYNMQFGTFVAGVEADVSWTNTKTDTRYSAPDQFLFPGAMTHTDVKSELEWLGTVRGRLGMTFDRALVFVTGGAAFGDVNNTFSISIPTAPAPLGPYFSPKWHKGGTEWGWTAGGGIEYAVTNNITVKAEYLYFDLGDETIRGTDGPNFGSEFIDYKFKNDGNIVRAGVNYQF